MGGGGGVVTVTKGTFRRNGSATFHNKNLKANVIVFVNRDNA